MVQAQSEAASVGIILPLPRDIPVLAQVEIHLATARTIEGGHQMIPRIADHLPAVIPHGLTARILYDDPAVCEDFGLGHLPDGLPDIGTLHLRVETLRNAARELYDFMRGITVVAMPEHDSRIPKLVEGNYIKWSALMKAHLVVGPKEEELVARGPKGVAAKKKKYGFRVGFVKPLRGMGCT
ncbi:hypothetical protein BKA93DRAFT_753580 [Sparassis latifolia]